MKDSNKKARDVVLLDDLLPGRCHICPICGREFYPTSEWVWGTRKIKVCRYNCQQKLEKQLEEKAKQNKRTGCASVFDDIEGDIIKRLKGGETKTEVATSLGRSEPALYRWLKLKHYNPNTYEREVAAHEPAAAAQSSAKS